MNKNTAEKFDSHTFYRLNLDKILDFLSVDRSERHIFEQVLKNAEFSELAVNLRQNSLKDVIKNREALERLLDFSEKLVKYKEETNKNEKEIFRTTLDKNLNDFVTARNVLSMCALTLKRTLLLIHAMENEFAVADFQAKPFSELRSSLSEITKNDRFPELLNLCTRFENFTTIGNLDFRIVLNEEGRIETCSLINHNYIEDLSSQKFGLSFRKNRIVSKSSEINGHLQIHTYASALVQFAADLNEIATFFLDKFSFLKNELLFYKIAVKYFDLLEKSGVEYCYPEFVSDNGFCFEKAYDLLLLFSADKDKVVPYSLDIIGAGKKGILILGDNHSGKTTFLRTVAILHILAAAGLPIPAKNAKLSDFSLIMTVFAESEKKMTDAGRFEQEASQISEAIDNIVPGSVVLLNEPFQSTNYDEGASALSDILNMFIKMNVRFILVSHIRQIENFIDKNDVLIIRTDSNYLIKPD